MSSSTSNQNQSLSVPEQADDLGPIDLSSSLGGLSGLGVDTDATISNTSKGGDSMDRSNTGPELDIRDEERTMEDGNPLENVIPVDKLKNGAANAMGFLSWGYSNLKEKAEKVAETESFHKMEEAITTAKVRANSAYEAKCKPAVEGISKKAQEAFESSKPKLDQLAENAKITLLQAKEKVVETTEACKPSVQAAAEKAAGAANSAFEETKSMFDKVSKTDRD